MRKPRKWRFQHCSACLSASSSHSVNINSIFIHRPSCPPLMLFSLTSHNYAVPIIARSQFLHQPQNFGHRMDQFCVGSSLVLLFCLFFGPRRCRHRLYSAQLAPSCRTERRCWKFEWLRCVMTIWWIVFKSISEEQLMGQRVDRYSG